MQKACQVIWGGKWHPSAFNFSILPPMSYKLLIPPFLLICALLCTCSDDSNPTYPIERTILDVSIAKRCEDGSFKPGANCYLLRWQHPYEKKDLQSYYVWIDTVVVNDSTQKPSQSQMDKAEKVIPYSNRGDGDSLDLTDLISGFLERDSLYIAIWAKYNGSDQGMIRHYHIYFGDDVPPLPVNFSDSASANRIWISWIRPTDQRDFYFPDITDGPIAGYNIEIKTLDTSENIRNANVLVSLGGNAVESSKVIRAQRFEKKGRSAALANIPNASPSYLRLAIADGDGYDINDMQNNNWRLEVSGLKPEQEYEISIQSWDIAGNYSLNVPKGRPTKTTDNIAPLIASKLWFDLDNNDMLPRLDSNRLVLTWLKSVDPLIEPTPIRLDSVLNIPENCLPGSCYQEVKDYLIEQWNGSDWETISDASVARSTSGDFVSDTLRRVTPGEEITLRIRAVDNSGHYSRAWISTFTASKGEFWQTKCPADFMPLKKDSSAVFCMEKFQHFNGDEFEKNVLYIEAKRICESLNGKSGFENFAVGLCTEREWNAACNGRGSSYGVIEEADFQPNAFLKDHCGTLTGNSLNAHFVSKRDRRCVSPDGIRDLPGQLQEWVIGQSDSGEVAILKGTSYAEFRGATAEELAQCKNRSIPTRAVLRYTTDSTDLKDTIFVYSLESMAGDYLGQDFVKKSEYNNRGGDKWLDVRWQGLKYRKEKEMQVLILGEETVVKDFFLDPSVGFRCCANFTD
jgi:hypothetical protein